MMCFKVQKFIEAGSLAIVYFSIRTFFWNWGMRDNRLAAGYTELEALNECITKGYFSTQEVVLIGTLCMLLFVEYVSDKEEAILILRYSSRNKYLQVRTIKTFLAVTVFCFIRTVVGILFLWIEFGGTLILTAEMGNFALWFTVISSLYAAHCSIAYLILRDFLNKKAFAFIMMMIAQLILYYIYMDQWLYFLIRREITWLPFCDIDAPSAVYTGIIGNSENYLVAIRQLCIALIVALACTSMWKRKDVMNIEK